MLTVEGPRLFTPEEINFPKMNHDEFSGREEWRDGRRAGTEGVFKIDRMIYTTVRNGEWTSCQETSLSLLSQVPDHIITDSIRGESSFMASLTEKLYVSGEIQSELVFYAVNTGTANRAFTDCIYNDKGNLEVLDQGYGRKLTKFQIDQLKNRGFVALSELPLQIDFLKVSREFVVNARERKHKLPLLK